MYIYIYKICLGCRGGDLKVVAWFWAKGWPMKLASASNPKRQQTVNSVVA